MPTPSYVIEALRQLVAVEPGYDQAAAFYEGDVPETFASQRLRQLLGNLHQTYNVNFARTPVDVLLERTYVAGITCSDPGIKALLEQCWLDNELGLEGRDLFRRAYEFGDAYLLGWPDDDLPSSVSLYAHDPRNVRVFYDPASPRTKTHAVHRWVEEAGSDNGLTEGFYQRVNMYFRDHVEQFVSRNRIDSGGYSSAVYGLSLPISSEPDLVPYADEGAPDGVAENPVPDTVPVFHFRTGRPYGRPEHADAYGPQRMINKLSTTMMASVDYAGFPQRYVTTDAALNPRPLDAFSDPASDITSTEQGLSEDSSLDAGPGETWLLSGSNVGVGQFAVANTSNFLDAIHSLIRQMATVTDLPGHYFDRSGQMPSGESFRMAETPLNKKTADRLAQFAVSWHEVFEYVQAVNGRLSSDAQVTWAPPQVYTDKESWDTAQAQLAVGVPLETIFIERGVMPELAAQWAAQAQLPNTVPATTTTGPSE